MSENEKKQRKDYIQACKDYGKEWIQFAKSWQVNASSNPPGRPPKLPR